MQKIKHWALVIGLAGVAYIFAPDGETIATGLWTILAAYVGAKAAAATNANDKPQTEP